MAKLWTREKPTTKVTPWYWYRISVVDENFFLGKLDLSGKKFVHEGAEYEIDSLAGWWAPATPPPFDGEE